MKTLYAAIEANAGIQSAALIKHLNASGILNWKDLTKSNLNDFRDDLLESVASSSARTYLAVLKVILGRYEEEVNIPCKSYREVLKAKKEKCVKTFLTQEELHLLEETPAQGDIELMVKCQFLIGAYTGMRISDIKNITLENIEGKSLRYVSQKTSIESVIPCSQKVRDLIAYAAAINKPVSLMGYNKAIRRLCKRAGICETVKVFKGGKVKAGEKWQFISSHSARISFATNLAQCNVPILSISKLCGHSSVVTTQGYIVNTDVQLNEKAMDYLR
jgi:integrase